MGEVEGAKGIITPKRKWNEWIKDFVKQMSFNFQKSGWRAKGRNSETVIQETVLEGAVKVFDVWVIVLDEKNSERDCMWLTISK